MHDKLKPLLFKGVSLEMCMLTAEEIREESAVRVTRSEDFDEFGRPIPNAVYDPRFGATKESLCGTCHMKYRVCPGHFGHIDLPLPVYHPMTVDLFYRLLRLSCLTCKRFKIGGRSTTSYVAQMVMAEKGLNGLCMEIMSLGKHENEAKIRKILEEQKDVKEIATDSALKQEIFRKMLEEAPKICTWCGSRATKMRFTNSKIIVERHFVEKNREITKKNELLLPIEGVAILQEVTKKEKEALEVIFRTAKKKKSGASFLVPVFFIETVLVTSLDFRPVEIIDGAVVHNARTMQYKRIVEIVADIFRLEKDKQEIAERYLELQREVSEMHLGRKILSGVKNSKGIKEILEKKEGLFRKHMMGKRVNYTLRSVISPDPSIEVNEVGIPEMFAQKLTIPVPVSEVTAEELKKAVENGPKYPGAEYVEDRMGRLINLRYIDEEKRRHMARQLLASPTPTAHSASLGKDEMYADEIRAEEETERGVRRVWRHMKNGDYILLNRQPSLHKVSMMGHRVKILKGEKTIRMHYVNCNSYNADFDGDEMNVHFPQDVRSQVELSEICSTDQCYISATNGAPVRGHVQDHVVMGAVLSQPGTFLREEEMHELVVSTGGPGKIFIEQPAVLRPVRMYTGKQAISVVIKNARAEVTVQGRSKMGDFVRIERGEVLTGTFDKSQIGTSSFGVVHAVNEIHGGKTANKLLTSVGKMLNRALCSFGYSCTMEDLLVGENGEQIRKKKIAEGRKRGKDVTERFLRSVPNYLPATSIAQGQGMQLDEKRNLDEQVKEAVSETGSAALEAVRSDLRMKDKGNKMYMMVASGAKGSLVNLGQIVNMLGQQELEGMRVPLMRTGRTLPTFAPLEGDPRANGFISQRFLTGIDAEEFYFHCMAGREGLIDTAVKTSRSGYLQRCLVKHLEGIYVDVDCTVKDADGSVVQMVYGEDGIHPEKSAYLSEHGFFEKNRYRAGGREGVWTENGRKEGRGEGVGSRGAGRGGAVEGGWAEGAAGAGEAGRLTVGEMYNFRKKYGRVSEKYFEQYRKYVAREGGKESRSAEEGGKEAGCEGDVWMRYVRNAAEPGECVGVLAAQSLGEPSTQMTLNTFHLAGVAGKNVTLGLPRLKEILQHATKKIKTPVLTARLRREITREEMEILEMEGKKEALSVVKSIAVEEIEEMEPRSRVLKIQIEPQSGYLEALKKTLGEEFSAKFEANLKQFVKTISKTQMKEDRDTERAAKRSADEDGEGGANEEKDNDEEKGEDEKEEGKKRKSGGKEGDEEEDESEGESSSNQGSEEKESEIENNEEAESDGGNSNAEKDGEEESSDGGGSAGETSSSEEEQLEGAKIRRKIVGAAESASVSECVCYSDGEKIHITVRVPVAYKTLYLSRIEAVLKKIRLKTNTDYSECTHADKQFFFQNGTIFGLCEMVKGVVLSDIFDVSGARQNSIWGVLESLGVEAARGAIIRELQGVFDVYGIKIDPRHLTVIADYMTYSGSISGFNRDTFRSMGAPMQKISYESAYSYIKSTVLAGKIDNLQNPSSCIAVGKPLEVGTNLSSVEYILTE